MNKTILDVTCGSKMMWFQKNNIHTVYADKRRLFEILCDGRTLEISPDIECDFTCLPFENEKFNLIVFDPPHLEKLGKNSWLAKKYGKLEINWRNELKKGFDECYRVLKPNGVLIFKWNENQIKVSEILKIIQIEPLFGHPSGRNGQTIWMTFMKHSEK